MSLTPMGPCCAVPSPAPLWTQEAARKINAYFSGRQFKDLQGMYHKAALIIPFCGERFVPAKDAAALWEHEARVIDEVKFTPTQTYQQTSLVLHEVGTLMLTAKPREGTDPSKTPPAVAHTQYYTRWFQTGTAEWSIAFQCLSVGFHDDAKEGRLGGICSVTGGAEAGVGLAGETPPDWLVEKSKQFADMYNAESTLSLVMQFYHPHAIMVPPKGGEMVQYNELRGYYKDHIARDRKGVTFLPFTTYAEGGNVLHELGCAKDASQRQWQYYVRWVKEDAVHDWQANVDLCVVADVHKAECAA